MNTKTNKNTPAPSGGDKDSKKLVFKIEEVTRLTQDQGNNESPSHSPDGHHIVFTSTREPGAGKQIYLMDVDGRNQRRVSRSGASHETPAWGPRLGHE